MLFKGKKKTRSKYGFFFLLQYSLLNQTHIKSKLKEWVDGIKEQKCIPTEWNVIFDYIPRLNGWIEGERQQQQQIIQNSKNESFFFMSFLSFENIVGRKIHFSGSLKYKANLKQVWIQIRNTFGIISYIFESSALCVYRLHSDFHTYSNIIQNWPIIIKVGRYRWKNGTL